MAMVTGAEPTPFRCMEIRGGSRSVDEWLRTPGLDVWIHCRPFEGDDTGGDVHYVSRCGGGVITRLIVADVDGHGARVAAFSESLRALLRKNINTKSQTRLVESLNRQFGEATDSLRFATAVVATYLANRRTLTVCNAGHPRPLWYRAVEKRWEPLVDSTERPGNFPLGLVEQSPYGQFTVTLGKGDVVAFYTDALIEARDREGRLLMEEGLLNLARQIDMTDPSRVGPSLLSAVDRHRDGRPADDDVTLVTLFHDAGGPRRPSLREAIGVYAKLLRLRPV
ncbi:MAG: PP2C family protein-serine/threonine phosphatase [Isosphaeraceae bacterium]